MTQSSNSWNIWIDTGGTFTDCIGQTPGGQIRKVKVLSSSALRGNFVEQLSKKRFRIRQEWDAPDDFIRGFELGILGADHAPLRVKAFDSETSVITVEGEIPAVDRWDGTGFEVVSGEEAPVLGCRLLTRTGPSEPLPPIKMRLATTRGTNALLEHKGAPTGLLITQGFGDLLLIGNQQRPGLFTLNIQKPRQLYEKVWEVPGRLDATGKQLEEVELSHLDNSLRDFLQRDNASLAVCLMHSYENSAHEQDVKEWLQGLGAQYISVSSELSPFIKILPRAQTTLVNAYLQPVLQQYLKAVGEKTGGGSLHVMTSAGGLVNARDFHPKDSLLSGPAGGVVGAGITGEKAGFNKVISFDMGGTSTDVSRYDHGFDYTFEHRVGKARLNAPAISIETVAAGGGSICSFDGNKLTVGPESAGAYPGPACYGAGGPLTLTDVNLLLGRVDARNFGIPIREEAARKRLDELREHIGHEAGETEILEGFLKIANERMADAIRKISLRKGYDPSGYALVAFGGAGAQHACAIAGELDIRDIVIPSDAGLLSACGLGRALIEQFAERQVMKNLGEIKRRIPDMVAGLEQEARDKLRQKEEVGDDIEIRRRLAYMRLSGQDSTIEVEYGSDLRHRFREAYEQRYGHWLEGGEIELESLRVVASTPRRVEQDPPSRDDNLEASPLYKRSIIFGGRPREAPVFSREELAPGQQLSGPAMVLDPYSTILIDPGWEATVSGDMALHLAKKKEGRSRAGDSESEAVALELFTNRFTAIAEEMGEMLKRTALSVNVKERMDFSCALLSSEGELVVNAPHIPVHLGALGLCVRRLQETVKMEAGDVVVTNHPAYGGSHLPDITVVTPVYNAEQNLLGYAASRAHHAEIGGRRPGSMPPDATSLAQEGVVMKPMHLAKGGREQWESVRRHLTESPYPTRSIRENMADLRAAVAANNRGARSLAGLAEQHGTPTVRHYMDRIRDEAAARAEHMLEQLPDTDHEAEERLDDGSLLKVRIVKKGSKMDLDFKGTSGVHPGNMNATPAIVHSVVMYVIRLLIDEPLPLNEGLLEPVTIHLPPSLLNPTFVDDPAECPAVVGGNTETSQRLVDLLLKPFGKAACSQGTMNNILFGNEQFGYYETVGGGTGAGPDFDGADAVHQHMTNTAGTDPEILEHRYPVRLERYAIRRNSGGKGRHPGGDGIEREMTFLQPVSLSVLTQHREESPYGLKGGKAGKKGRQWVISNGTKITLSSVDGCELEKGDRFILHTPGGGGFGGD